LFFFFCSPYIHGWLHVWISCVTRMNKLCHEYVVPPIYMDDDTYVRHTCCHDTYARHTCRQHVCETYVSTTRMWDIRVDDAYVRHTCRQHVCETYVSTTRIWDIRVDDTYVRNTCCHDTYVRHTCRRHACETYVSTTRTWDIRVDDTYVRHTCRQHVCETYVSTTRMWDIRVVIHVYTCECVVSHIFLQHSAPHTAKHHNTVQHSATHVTRAQHCLGINALHHTLQHTATHSNTLQHIATICNTLRDILHCGTSHTAGSESCIYIDYVYVWLLCIHIWMYSCLFIFVGENTQVASKLISACL